MRYYFGSCSLYRERLDWANCHVEGHILQQCQRACRFYSLYLVCHLVLLHHHLHFIIFTHDEVSKYWLSASQSHRAKGQERGCAQAAGAQPRETEMKRRIEVRAGGSKEAERMSDRRT